MALPEKGPLPGKTHQIWRWDVITHRLAVSSQVMGVDVNDIGFLHGNGYHIKEMTDAVMEQTK